MVDVSGTLLLALSSSHSRQTESRFHNIGRANPRMTDHRRIAGSRPMRGAQPQPRQNRTNDQLSHTPYSLGVANTYHTAPSAYPSGQPNPGSITNWLPQATNTIQQQRVDHQYDSTYTAEPWPIPEASVVQQGNYLQSLVPRSRQLPPRSIALAPTIQIITDTNNHTAAALRRPQEGHLTSFDTFRPYEEDYTYQGNLLNPQPYGMATQQPEISTQHVPVSPVSRHSAGSRGVSPLPEPTTRKRSFSQLDQETQPSPQESNASHHPASPDGVYMDDGRPAQRIVRTIKRREAPMNAEHKYVCDVSDECSAFTFERKCEWSKHMDKHDRPYRCEQPECAKLQGFTYSGGLLRHEREVHNKHGGPKAFLMCPHLNCKRHTEKGFTRKENLLEHLRRVHTKREDSSQTRHEADIAAGADLDTPASALSAGDTDGMYAALDVKKRAVGSDDRRDSFEDVHELRTQVQRLKAENDAKSATIHRLEEDCRSQGQRILALEQALQRIQHPTDQAG